MIDPKLLEGLNAVRKDIHERVQKHNTPTISNMARNTLMFLDSAYMWYSTLDQVMEDQAGQTETAGAPEGVIQGNFGGQPQG